MLQKNKPTTITTTVGLATLAMTMINTLQVLAQNENNFDSLPVNDLGIEEEENQEQEQTEENNGEEEEEVEEETWDEEEDGSTTHTNNEDQTQGKNYENNNNEDDDENSDSLMEPDTEEDETPQPEIIGTLGKDNEPPTDYAPEVLDVAGNEDEEDTFGDEEDEEEEEEKDEYKQALLQQQEQRQDDEELKQELAEEDSQLLQQNEEDFKMKDEEALLNQQLVEEQYDSNDGVVIDSNDIIVDEQQEEEQQQQQQEEENGDVDDNDAITITTPTINKQQIEENNDLDQELANEGFEEDEDLLSQIVQPLPIPPITQEQQQKERISNKEWETNDEYTIQNQAIYQNEWTEGDDLGKEQELEQQQDKDEADLSDIPSAEPQSNVNPVIPEPNGEEQDNQRIQPLQPLPVIDDDNKVTEQYDHNIDQSLEKALEMDAANIPWYEDSNAKNEDPDFLKENNLSKEQNIMQGQLSGGITNGDNSPVLANADYNNSSSSNSSRRSSMLIMLIFIFMILFILRKRWLKIITRQKNSSTLPFYRNPYSKQSLD